MMVETKKVGAGGALASTLRKIVAFAVNEAFGGYNKTCLL